MPKVLSRDDVVKVAHLSRIKLSNDEIDSFVDEINQIVEYIKKLQEADVSGLEPTDQVNGLSNVWREDKVADYGYKAKDLLSNVPDLKDGYIKVNRMV